MRAAVYARFSSDNQRSESIDAQIRAIEKYCVDENIEIVERYIDEAKTATTDQRPAFQRMISHAKNGLFEVVVVHKLDRFSRSRKDSITYKAILASAGVKVVSVTEPLNDSPESIILESVIEGMAEYYSLNLSREVMKGLKENALHCKHTGGMPPLGYDVDPITKMLVINEKEAPAVKLIFQSIIRGKGYGEIIKELNDRGYRTKKGNLFGKNSLYEIIRNEKYHGVYSYNQKAGKDGKKHRNNHRIKNEDDIIRIPNGVPALISDEDFFSAQQILNARRNADGSRKAKEVYLLTGKLQCGECGASYCGSRKYSGRNKRLHVTYRCNRRDRGTSLACHNPEINRDYLESHVLSMLSEIIFAEHRIPEIVDNYNKLISLEHGERIQMIQQMEHELNEMNCQIRNLTEVIAKTGNALLVDSLEEKEKAFRKLQGRVHTEKRKIETVKVDESLIKEGFYRAKELFASGNTEDIRCLINIYLNKAVIYPDHIDISVNAFPGYKEHNIFDIEVSNPRPKERTVL